LSLRGGSLFEKGGGRASGETKPDAEADDAPACRDFLGSSALRRVREDVRYMVDMYCTCTHVYVLGELIRVMGLGRLDARCCVFSCFRSKTKFTPRETIGHYMSRLIVIHGTDSEGVINRMKSA
jgi:hypothetical protein